MTSDPRYAGPNPPRTSIIVDRSLFVRILPEVEQAALFNAINSSTCMTGLENTTAHTVAVATYACPSDVGAGHVREFPAAAEYRLAVAGLTRWSMVFASYSGNYGSLTTAAIPTPENRCAVDPRRVAQSNGLFHDCSPVRLADIVDGLGTTLLVGEKATGLYPAYYPDQPEGDRWGWWVEGNWGATLQTAFFPPNAYRSLGPHTMPYSASSDHPGGVNFAFADGSVRFVKDSIQSWPIDETGLPLGVSLNPGGWWDDVPPPGVWQALATRNGGEAIGDASD